MCLPQPRSFAKVVWPSSVNNLSLNCLNPKHRHNDGYLYTCFSYINSFIFQKMSLLCEPQNLIVVLELLFLGFSDDPELWPLIFGLFLTMYPLIILGNLFVILTVSSDSHLQAHIYFCLSILSTADISFTSTTVPKMILDSETHSRVIFYAGFLIQLSFLF